MALQLLDTVAPCFDYTLNAGGGYVYNPALLVLPRIYNETISSVKQFFYDPVKDVYVTWVIMSYAYWPGWRMYRLVWNGADGPRNDAYTTSNVGIIFSHWTNDICVGGYNKFYATGNSYLDIKEIDWVTETWTGWTCYDWAGRDPLIFRHAIVNRKDSIFAGIASGPVMDIYNFSTHARLGRMAILDHSLNMAYEDDSHLWLIHATGQLTKINYQTQRHEMLSKVADPAPEDIAYRCAFDTNRKRLAILRHKPDAVDGACRLQLEFYSPIPQARIITAPVPVHSLAAGTQITFSAHVLGDSGEGIASQAVTATLEAPAAGRLVTGQLFTGLNGSIAIDYVAPNGEAIESINLSAEV